MSIKSAFFAKWGKNLFRDGSPELALGMFDRAIKADPRHLNAYLDASDVMLSMGRLEEALKLVDQAIIANPEKTEKMDKIREISEKLRAILENRRLRRKVLDQNLIFDVFAIGGGRLEFTLENTLTGERQKIKNGSLSAADVKCLVLGLENLPKNCEFHQAIAIMERVELHKNESSPTEPITQGRTLEDGSSGSEEIRLEDIPF